MSRLGYDPTAAPKRATEADCQRTIIEAARLAGWLVHHTRPAQMQSGKWATPLQGDPGFVDLVLCHPARGLLWFVELKRKPNKATAAQQQWMFALADVSDDISVQFVWVPDELDAFIARLVSPLEKT